MVEAFCRATCGLCPATRAGEKGQSLRANAQKSTVCSDHDPGVLSATDGLASSCEELVAKAGFDTVCRSADDDTVAMVEAFCRATCGLCQRSKDSTVGSVVGVDAELPGTFVHVGAGTEACGVTCRDMGAVCHAELTQSLNRPGVLASYSLAVGCSTIVVGLDVEVPPSALPVIRLTDGACFTSRGAGATTSSPVGACRAEGTFGTIVRRICGCERLAGIGVAEALVPLPPGLPQPQGEDNRYLAMESDHAELKAMLEAVRSEIGIVRRAESETRMANKRREVARQYAEAKSNPLAHLSPQSVVVVVLSARGHFEQRNAIRETWAKGFGTVFFIVGEEACSIPSSYRVRPKVCEAKSMPPHAAQLKHYAEMRAESVDLKLEKQVHEDTVLVPMVDYCTSDRLPAHFAIAPTLAARPERPLLVAHASRVSHMLAPSVCVRAQIKLFRAN